VKLAPIAVLSLVLATGGAAQARTISQVVPASVAFWTANNGLMASVIYGPTARSQGQLAVTNDGGRTWSIRWRGRAAWDVSVIPGTAEAWAAISPRGGCLDCPMDLLHSRDQGLTWQLAKSGLSLPSFPTARVGFALRSRQADAGPLMRTLNGGHTWRRVRSPCDKGWGGYAWAGAVSFVSPRHGWLLCTGQPGAGSQSKAIYVTKTSGASWTRLVNVHFEPGRVRSGGLHGDGYPRGLSFTPSGRGILWEARGDTYRTADGGRHWRGISVTSPEDREGLSASFVSDRVGYLLLQDSGRRLDWELLRTRNAGRSWRVVRSWARR
jgi:photosystem II stability/assembly factor-like uncharacterized protein